MEKRQRFLNILFSTLLFGGIWGILEATLGSLLHMHFIPSSILLSSSAIMLPIAYLLMGACYKRTGTFRSVIYMGLLTASIKAIACLIFHMAINPVYYILMESAFMAISLLVIRPKNILSFRGLGTMIVANTLYLSVSTFLRVDVMHVTQSLFFSNLEKYTLTINMIAVLYSLAIGAILYGISKLAVKFNWDISKIKNVIYHPAFASGVSAIALVLTLVIR